MGCLDCTTNRLDDWLGPAGGLLSSWWRGGAPRRPSGSLRSGGGTFLLEEGFPAETNFARRIDIDDLDQQLFTLAELVAHVFHPMVRNLGDVQQAVRARHDLDERAKIGDPLHLAQIRLVELGRRRQL